ncbi:MAG: carboxypeptidase-like regulatory domain-containing protein, partial [Acidobacteriota bacterium]
GIVLVAVLVSVAAPAWPQTTTGRLIGMTVSQDGAALAGVSVTIDSPSLIGGAQTRITDDKGEYSFVGIAPGFYTVKAERAGFVPQERAQVKVSLGHAVSLNIAMPQGTFSGEIEVVDETPVVDPTQVNTGQVFDRGYMQNSAIGSVNRNYLTVVNQTAGVAGGGAWDGVPQPRVFGSTIGENAYFIDGVDTTDPVMATATVTMNFDAIGEIQFQTGKLAASRPSTGAPPAVS